jgi:hypothetical protein
MIGGAGNRRLKSCRHWICQVPVGWSAIRTELENRGHVRLGDHTDRAPDESDMRKGDLAGQLILSEVIPAEITRAGGATQSSRSQELFLPNPNLTSRLLADT